jgi:hypothetical protein
MHDKRIEARKPLHERVDLEIISDGGSEGGPGGVAINLLDCRTVDVSPSGLRLMMNQSVPVGTIMNMCVVVDGGERRFHLTAEIRWIRPSPEPGWLLAGFEIYDTEYSDSAAWRYFLQRVSARKP